MSDEKRSIPPEIMRALREVGMPERVCDVEAIAKWLVNEDREFNALLAERDALRAEVEQLKRQREHITAGYHRRKDELNEQYHEVEQLKAQLADEREQHRLSVLSDEAQRQELEAQLVEKDREVAQAHERTDYWVPHWANKARSAEAQLAALRVACEQRYHCLNRIEKDLAVFHMSSEVTDAAVAIVRRNRAALSAPAQPTAEPIVSEAKGLEWPTAKTAAQEIRRLHEQLNYSRRCLIQSGEHGLTLPTATAAPSEHDHENPFGCPKCVDEYMHPRRPTPPAAPSEPGNFHDFAAQQADWSRAAFGPDNVRGPEGPLRHLLKEAQEVLAMPSDVEEYADCLFLVLDAARRAGFDSRKLLAAAWLKLAKNRAREWPDWRSAPLNQAIEHVRPAADEPIPSEEPRGGNTCDRCGEVIPDYETMRLGKSGETTHRHCYPKPAADEPRGPRVGPVVAAAAKRALAHIKALAADEPTPSAPKTLTLKQARDLALAAAAEIEERRKASRSEPADPHAGEE